MKHKTTILIVGRTHMVLDEVRKKLTLEHIGLVMATDLDEVKAAFEDAKINMAIMGAGIEFESRLDIVRCVFQASTSTSVHMKDADSDPKFFAIY